MAACTPAGTGHLMWRYGAHGLGIESQIELSGLVPLAADRRVDLTIDEGPPVAIESSPPPGRLLLESGRGEGRWVVIAENDQGWAIRYPGFAQFDLSADRRTLVATRDPALEPEWLGVLAIDNPMALIVGLDDDIALHASAVHVGGRSIAFVGPSGLGKSTVSCSVATARGATIISDDLLRISTSPIACFLGAVELRLRPGPTSDLLAAGAQRRTTVDGRVAIRCRPVPTDQLPLDAIVLPRPSRDASVPDVERVEPSDALLHLLGQTRLVGWLDPVHQRHQFEAIAELVDEVPVLVARIPWAEVGPAAVDPLVDAILSVLDDDVSCP